MLLSALWAQRRRDTAARLWPRCGFMRERLLPLIRLPGQSRNQLQNSLSLFQRVISSPISLIKAWTLKTSRPGTAVKSTPQIDSR